MRPVLVSVAAMIAAAAAVQAAEVPPTAVEPDDYGAVATPLADQPGDPERGREVLISRSLGNCVACHAAEDYSDVQWHGEVGPALDGVGDRWGEAELRGIMVNAKNIFPETIMPAFYKTEGFVRPGDAYSGEPAGDDLPPLLSAQQVEDVVAYLMTLK